MGKGEKTTVEAHFGLAGEITPRRFTWRGSTLSVEGLGRRWQEGGKRFFLVLAAGERAFELQLDENTFRWRVSRISASRRVV